MILPFENTRHRRLLWRRGRGARGSSGNPGSTYNTTLHYLGSVNNTIRIVGMANGKLLRILVDSGSTNNFLDPNAAKRVKATLTDTTPISISIADWFKVPSYQQCSALHWTVQGEELVTDFRILPLGGIDAVIGVQWLKVFNLITFDFDQLQLSFGRGDNQAMLQGESDQVPPSVQLLTTGELKKTLNAATHGYFGYIFGMYQAPHTKESQIAYSCALKTKIDSLLGSFSKVVQEPKGLPPNRSHNHHINLKEGSQPVNLRPCKYPYVQKEEIEKIVNDMLASGIIQPNTPLCIPSSLSEKT